jgi:hypothetical protein
MTKLDLRVRDLSYIGAMCVSCSELGCSEGRKEGVENTNMEWVGSQRTCPSPSRALVGIGRPRAGMAAGPTSTKSKEERQKLLGPT